MNKRPTGITLIAIVYIILGFLSLLWSGLIFGVGGLGSLFGSVFGADAIAAAGSSGAWNGFVGIFAAIVQLAVGFGLFAMKRWAWYLALVGVGISVLQGVLGLFSGGVFVFLCGILGLLIPAAILAYLLSPNIRGLFGIDWGA